MWLRLDTSPGRRRPPPPSLDTPQSARGSVSPSASDDADRVLASATPVRTRGSTHIKRRSKAWSQPDISADDLFHSPSDKSNPRRKSTLHQHNPSIPKPITYKRPRDPSFVERAICAVSRSSFRLRRLSCRLVALASLLLVAAACFLFARYPQDVHRLINKLPREHLVGIDNTTSSWASRLLSAGSHSLLGASRQAGPAHAPQIVRHHTWPELMGLPSAGSSAYEAVIVADCSIHCSLDASLDAFAIQTLVPRKITLVLSGVTEAPAMEIPPALEHIQIRSHLIRPPVSPDRQPRSLAEVSWHVLSEDVASPYALVVEAHPDDHLQLPSSFAENIIRVANTHEYSNTILTAAGYIINFDSRSDCRENASSSHWVHFPSSRGITLYPTLPLHHARRPPGTLNLGAYPLHTGLALASWISVQLGSFVLPLEMAPPHSDSSSSSSDSPNASSLCDSAIADASFAHLRPLFSDYSLASSYEPDLAVLAADESEIDLFTPLLCSLSHSQTPHVLIVPGCHQSFTERRVFFVKDSASSRQRSQCVVSITCSADPIESLMDLAPLVLFTVDTSPLLDAAHTYRTHLEQADVDFVRAASADEGLHAMSDDPTDENDPDRDDPNRDDPNTDSDAAHNDDPALFTLPTIISLPRSDLAIADWIGALSVDALRNWHKPTFDLSVITNNRNASLSRLLDSLSDAHYFGDSSVNLAISVEQTAGPSTLQLVESFPWSHGAKTVRHRIVLGGLMPAIVESWYPSSDDNFGILLEDDIEVSPMFYAWAKFSLLKYRYGTSDSARDRLFGISLYQPQTSELNPEGRRPFNAHALFQENALPPNIPYLFQVPCSWGAVYFPEVWREFHHYLSLRLSEISLPISHSIVPGNIRSNSWPRSWKRYFVELVYLRGYFMLYPNHDGLFSFSTNHLEVGDHIHTKATAKNKKLFTTPLFPDNMSIIEGLPDAQLPSFPVLPRLDLLAALVSDRDLMLRAQSTLFELQLCPLDKAYAAVLAQNRRALMDDGSSNASHSADDLLCQRTYSDRTNKMSFNLEEDPASEIVS